MVANTSKESGSNSGKLSKRDNIAIPKPNYYKGLLKSKLQNIRSNRKLKLLLLLCVLVTLLVTVNVILITNPSSKKFTATNKSVSVPVESTNTDRPFPKAEKRIIDKVEHTLVSEFQPLDFSLYNQYHEPITILNDFDDNNVFYYSSDSKSYGIINHEDSPAWAKRYDRFDQSYTSDTGLFFYINTDGNIWVRNLDKSINYQITKQSFPQDEIYLATRLRSAVWSDGGRYLVFQVEYWGCREIECADLVPNPNVEYGFYVADLFEGKVYYTQNIEYPKGFLPKSHKLLSEKGYIYNLDDYSISNYPYNNPVNTQLHFSKTMKYLAYQVYQIEHRCVNCGYSGIFLADLTNNAQKLIAEGTFAEYQWPTVSPDESMLAFQRSLEGGLSVVMVYNIANTQTIETINAYSYYWSPDNTLIIYSPYEDSDEFRSYVIYDPSTNEYSNVLRYNSSTGEIIEGNIQNYY
jgi:hypothetical protein